MQTAAVELLKEAKEFFFQSGKKFSTAHFLGALKLIYGLYFNYVYF